MNLQKLQERSAVCEFCGSNSSLTPAEINPKERTGIEGLVLLCGECSPLDPSDSHHWSCLNEAIWSEHTPVKVLAYQMLHKLRDHSWAIDLIEQIYLEDDDLKWAQSGVVKETSDVGIVITRDSNGVELLEGDSVTLVKDLDVKGAGFTAKRGTLVKNIKLTENPKHIEGRVNGIQIVLVANFLKKV